MVKLLSAAGTRSSRLKHLTTWPFNRCGELLPDGADHVALMDVGADIAEDGGDGGIGGDAVDHGVANVLVATINHDAGAALDAIADAQGHFDQGAAVQDLNVGDLGVDCAGGIAAGKRSDGGFISGGPGGGGGLRGIGDLLLELADGQFGGAVFVVGFILARESSAFFLSRSATCGRSEASSLLAEAFSAVAVWMAEVRLSCSTLADSAELAAWALEASRSP